ncbi:CobW family GTP-binding protein [Croceicoccus naphthovorans]|uniref:ATP-binding protein n=1 Tax=Croceicoccus naphthovorans TaxID=1348774 RepID=A0A0G3XES4_9SPHN|nr:GTP-binding protein [Croceicoccus naphthovorans]AKM09094.1 ATP-binding protein [Croceicoccus naphthovorans]MBB3991664.1 G3E family GTPase [Croceicoccus naphthovorans]
MSALLTGSQSLIPVSIFTGFLGSGKTTLLNHLVRSPAMNRALVIINEFGSVSLDHDLIARSSDDLVVEMIGGCLCCTIRGDLMKTLRDAPWRFARDDTCWFDRVVIETTGLADPAPILHTLMTDDHLLPLYRLDGVIATVDAAAGMATLDTQEEAVKQVALADRILITKTDLVTEQGRSAVETRLKALNPAAPIIQVVNGIIDAANLFDVGLYNPGTKSMDVQRWLAAEAYEGSHDHGNHHGNDHGHSHEDHHHHDVNRHDDRIQATCLTFDEPLDPQAFENWIDILTMFKGQDVLRIKGILNLKGEEKPVVIHGVQHLFHPPVRLDAWPSDDRRTRLVFITRDISADELRDTLALMTTGLDRYGLQGLISEVPANGLLVETANRNWQ